MGTPQFSANAISLKAMNTDIAIRANGLNKQLQDNVIKWFKRFESICSRFRTDSELTWFNHQKEGKIIFVDEILYEVLDLAYEYAKQTDFYFNPLIGTAMEQEGYYRSFPIIKQTQSLKNNKINYILPDEESLIFYPSIHAIKKNIDQKVDLGGFGKGWSVDKAYQLMVEWGIHNGVVNAGGDLFIWGDKEETIGIAHPFNEEVDIAQFTIKKGTVVTSNKIYRSWVQDKKQKHHILNGKTGQVADHDVVQVTVIADQVAKAEVIAKVLLILPFKEGIQWMYKKFPDAGCICIHEKGDIAISKTINNFVGKVSL